MKSRSLIWLVLAASLAHATIAEAQRKRGPFTEPPRSVRSRPYDVLHTRLDLTFDWDNQEVRGQAQHRLRPFAKTRQLRLDAAEMTIHKVAVGRAGSSEPPRSAKFQTKGHALTITLDKEYGPKDELVVTIDYLVRRPRRGVYFVLPDKQEPDQQRIVRTQSEAEDARYWFPCFDSPTERMSSEVLATVPGDYFVLSNGTLQGKRRNPDGTQTWHWSQKKTHVPYLISVVAGRFEAYEQQWDGIPIISYVPPGRMPDAERSFGKTPQMMKLFCEKIGYRYPWAKYAQICCDEYGGGMEHTSATTLGLSTLHDDRAHLDVSSDNLVAHELVHQWWGDLLTCKDWAELWLNESFATYFATLWTEHDQGWDEATWKRHQEALSYMNEDRQRYRRPIVTYRYQRPGNMFDRHSYPKGGRVLHMLRFQLGDEMFWKAMKHYCHKHAYGIVETADLRVAIEEATGQSLNWFFQQWVYRGGHPEFEVDYDWDAAEKLVRLTVKQTQKPDELTPLFRVPVEIELVTDKPTLTRRITVSKAEETFHFGLDDPPRRVCFDPRDWALKTLKFEKSKQEWLGQLRESPHVICRLRAVQGLATLRGDDEARDALIEACRGEQSDKFWGVRQEAAKLLGASAGEKVRAALLAAAEKDPKSHVRREAIKALQKFPHEETRKLLRRVIEHDRSYYAVAEALRTLVKVDRQAAAKDLLAALDRPSHQEVILKAACDGLADLQPEGALDKLMSLVRPPCTAQRRSAVLPSLARLGRGDPKVLKIISLQLEDTRRSIRSRAVSALASTNDPAVIDLLLSRRDRERSPRVLTAIDSAIEKLGNSPTLGKVQKKLTALEKENRKLRERIKALEKQKR